MINDAKDFLADPAKNMNKLNKDDKVKFVDHFNVKSNRSNLTFSQKKMEKYVTDALKWSDENQNMPNARELFANKSKEAEEFLVPFYGNILCKQNKENIFIFSFFLKYLLLFLADADLNNPNISNTSRHQLSTPKSGKKQNIHNLFLNTMRIMIFLRETSFSLNIFPFVN